MEYPRLRVPSAGRQMQETFLGYNHSLRIGDGEFYDMENMTSDHYPLLSPRKKRGIYTKAEQCGGMIAKDCLCYVSGSQFVINGRPVEMELTEGDKQLIGMGAYVVILPDRKYINTLDDTDIGRLDAEYVSRDDVSFTLCRADGTGYDGQIPASAEPPEAPGNMEMWIDTSETPHTLKQYSADSGMWIQIATTYVRIYAPGLGAAFSQYDGVTISGIAIPALKDLNGSHTVWACDENSIVVTGILDQTVTQSAQLGAVTVQRKMPRMDFVIECGNRLWGCYYGIGEDGKPVNEIYCSKLGDFKNWQCYMGIATDSWATSVGSDGPFTGAVSYLGYPVFFKENVLHKVYPSQTGAHQVVDNACDGVQSGSSKSLAVVGTTLYYKSSRGICAYDGSLPVEIGQALGGVRYQNAVAGVDGGKYYICMEEETGVHHLFVLDTDRGLWHKEDHTKVTSFCTCAGELYFYDALQGTIKTVSGTGETDPEELRWMAQTGPVGLSTPDMKYISRLTLRLKLPPGSVLQCFAEYDSDGVWKQLFTLRGQDLRSFTIPVQPLRCDHLRLKLTGTGDMKLYSITKTIEQGSDVP